ncbi:MAG TPA: hypothetical protein VML55_06925 [Planctomycetaceae bacterium]|nr:hypothetical protein [Planctomycetaceae bacterium]
MSGSVESIPSTDSVPVRVRLKRMVEDYETRGGRLFNLAIQGLILLSVVRHST